MPGCVEQLTSNKARGWFFASDLTGPVKVEVYWADRIVGSGVAERRRPDLERLGPGGGGAFEVALDHIPDFERSAALKLLKAYAVASPADRRAIPLWDKLAAELETPEGSIAYLFLAYRAPCVLARTIAHLSSEQDKAFVHVDAKADAGPFADKMPSTDRATFLEPRIDVRWGAFSMVEAEVRLLRSALKAGRFSKFVLLSDDTFPLRAPRAVRQAILKGEFGFPARKVAASNASFLARYNGFHYFGAFDGEKANRWYTEADAAQLADMLFWMEAGKKQVELWHGTNWCVFTRAEAEFVVRTHDQDHHLRKSFTYSRNPDEMYFQTALCADGAFRPGMPPVYSEWPTRNEFRGPRLFSDPAELEKAAASDRLFVRKLSPDKPQLMDFIENHIWSRSGATASGAAHDRPGPVAIRREPATTA